MSSKDKEKKDIYTVIEGFSFKRFLKYKFILLIMFLLLAGIISYLLLSTEARKLAGGKRYSELLAGRGSYSSFNLIEKIRYAFNSMLGKEKDTIKNIDNDSKMKDENILNDEEKIGENVSKKSGGSGGGSKSSLIGKNYSSSAKGLNNSMLESSLTSLSPSLSEGVSKTSLSSFDSYSSPNVKIKDIGSKVGISYGKKAEEEKTAMSLLKSTFKTTLMAARDASNDTARAWTSKAFDYTPDIKQTIEYDEKLRAELDRINPNSIPAFLKDPALDPESMKSLKVSEVPGLSSEEENRNNFNIDINDIKNQMQNYNDKKQELLNNLSNLNPLFNMKETSGEQELTEEEIDKKSYSVNTSNPNVATTPEGKVVTQPSDPPDLGNEVSNVTTDEYGYIRVTQKDGSIQIFDPDSGKILGCEIPDAGMCLLPGADNCPKDIYFT
ncbi:MAG: hypothetical protein N2Z20_00760 [Elusimicrobiales bacterium]|nr:hypothetical protein [Elusimicrobiales bacterium]